MRHCYLSFLITWLSACPAIAGSIEFVVAELPGAKVHNDSYVISIDESDLSRLSHARALVEWVASGARPQDSPGATIVLANIKAGTEGDNRNVLATGTPSWSWQSQQPVDFADFTVEILDGWPTFVEQDVEGWIANTNGAVGFWSYTVVEEVVPVPEPESLTMMIGFIFCLLGAWTRKSRRHAATHLGGTH